MKFFIERDKTHGYLRLKVTANDDNIISSAAIDLPMARAIASSDLQKRIEALRPGENIELYRPEFRTQTETIQ